MMESSRKNTKCSVFCNCEKELASIFSMNGDISYCNNDDEMMRALGHEHKPDDWQLFIGS
jgi:hypothetical protein